MKLNLVEQLDAIPQADAELYQRTKHRKAHMNGYKELSLKKTSMRTKA
jgi:hypothetical protein